MISSFPLGLLAVGFERYGNEEELANNAIMHLFYVYVTVTRDATREKEEGGPEVTNDKARDFFKRMENGDHFRTPSDLHLIIILFRG
jgi:arginyl-tRNA synthetase